VELGYGIEADPGPSAGSGTGGLPASLPK